MRHLQVRAAFWPCLRRDCPANIKWFIVQNHSYIAKLAVPRLDRETLAITNLRHFANLGIHHFLVRQVSLDLGQIFCLATFTLSFATFTFPLPPSSFPLPHASFPLAFFPLLAGPAGFSTFLRFPAVLGSSALLLLPLLVFFSALPFDSASPCLWVPLVLPLPAVTAGAPLDLPFPSFGFLPGFGGDLSRASCRISARSRACRSAIDSWESRLVYCCKERHFSCTTCLFILMGWTH